MGNNSGRRGDTFSRISSDLPSPVSLDVGATKGAQFFEAAYLEGCSAHNTIASSGERIRTIQEQQYSVAHDCIRATYSDYRPISDLEYHNCLPVRHCTIAPLRFQLSCENTPPGCHPPAPGGRGCHFLSKAKYSLWIPLHRIQHRPPAFLPSRSAAASPLSFPARTHFNTPPTTIYQRPDHSIVNKKPVIESSSSCCNLVLSFSLPLGF